ncbi:hypothetical protein ALP94_03059 [Pseudomonas savastanoi pv. glycinea]|nr:hypothetical protein ALP94_03059 [Pseudomonas savastanoi pv. glycinea]
MDEVDAGTWPKRQVPVLGFKGEVVLPKTIRIVIGNTSICLTGPGLSADGIPIHETLFIQTSIFNSQYQQ